MLSLFLLRGKALVNVSLQDFCRYDGTPNHLHGDNANELMKGDALATCREKCIKVTATEADHPNQNHAAEYMIGVIKQMTMFILERKQLIMYVQFYILNCLFTIKSCFLYTKIALKKQLFKSN